MLTSIIPFYITDFLTPSPFFKNFESQLVYSLMITCFWQIPEKYWLFLQKRFLTPTYSSTVSKWIELQVESNRNSFLDVSSHLYKWVCPCECPCPYVNLHPANPLKIAETKWKTLWILPNTETTGISEKSPLTPISFKQNTK